MQNEIKKKKYILDFHELKKNSLIYCLNKSMFIQIKYINNSYCLDVNKISFNKPRNKKVKAKTRHHS